MDNQKNSVNKLVVIIGLIALFIFPLFARSLYESYNGVKSAEQALQQGDINAAIDSYAEAVRWRGIINPFAQRAATELYKLCTTLEGEQRIHALKEYRRALFVSRSFYNQNADEKRIIEYLSRELEVLGVRKPSPITASEPFTISYRYQILSQLGFWGWVASMLLLIRYSVNKEGKFKKKPLFLFLVLTGIIFAFWLIMLRSA